MPVCPRNVPVQCYAWLVPCACAMPAHCGRAVVALLACYGLAVGLLWACSGLALGLLWACCGLAVGLLARGPERANKYRSALFARCSLSISLLRAPLLPSRLLVFRSWVVFLVSGVPRLEARRMAPVTRCSVPVYRRRGPVSNLSVPVACAMCLFPCVKDLFGGFVFAGVRAPG